MVRFVLIFFVVMIHAYSSSRSIIDSAQYPVYRTVSFLFSLEISQIAVPAFFFISGYLFFYRDSPYPRKMKKEARTLLVPYMLWNALTLVLYLCLESIPAFSSFFSGNNLPVRDYNFADVLRAFWDGGNWDGGNGTPILHQFWYIRNLLLLGLLSPLVRLFVKRLGFWGAAALLVAWLFTPGQAFMAGSAAFFTAGACFSLRGGDFLPVFRRYSRPAYIVWPSLLLVNMLLRNHFHSVFLERTGFIAGLVFVVVLTADCIRLRGAKAPASYAFLRRIGFFIFAFHDPMLTFVKRLALKLMGAITDLTLTVTYFLAPVVVVFICLAVYKVLVRISPRTVHLLTGR